MTFQHFKLTIVALLFITGSAFSQQKLSTKDKFSIQEANGAFINGAYDQALEIYQKVLVENKNNAFLNYRVGFCLLELNEIEEAISYFELVKANQLKKKYFDYHFAYGQALQKQGKYNTALEKYLEFEKTGRKKDLEYHEVSRFIAQCKYAIEAVKSPVTVQLSSVGDYVNSPFDDFHPIVTIDGKMMVFTSRRSSENNENLLPDNQYYENIYFSLWDSNEEIWGEAKLMEGKINSDQYDANTGISADGQQLLIYKNLDELNNKMFASVGSGDILISKLGKNNKWGRPKLVEGLNSEYFDGGACFSADGKKIFFISDREGFLHKGSVGQKDIWVSELQADRTWGKPVNLGANVNTPNNEISVYVHPNGTTLFFASEGHDDSNFGGYDIFKTELVNGKWTKAVNLGFPLNTAKDEKEFMLTVDGKTGWISSKMDAPNKMNIFQVDLSFYDVISGKSDPLTIVKGKIADGSTGLLLETKVKFTNKSTGAVTEVLSNSNGEYTAPLISNSTYDVSAVEEGYKMFNKQLAVKLPPKPQAPKKKKRKKRGESEKAVTTAEIHTTSFNLSLERTTPLNIISKSLFTVKTLRFNKTDTGYVLNEFSVSILDKYILQLKSEPSVKLEIWAHYDDDSNDYEVSLGKSNHLGKMISDYLKASDADMSRVKIVPVGNSQPMADSDTPEGKALNRRVEVRIKL